MYSAVHYHFSAAPPAPADGLMLKASYNDDSIAETQMYEWFSHENVETKHVMLWNFSRLSIEGHYCWWVIELWLGSKSKASHFPEKWQIKHQDSAHLHFLITSSLTSLKKSDINYRKFMCAHLFFSFSGNWKNLFKKCPILEQLSHCLLLKLVNMLNIYLTPKCYMVHILFSCSFLFSGISKTRYHEHCGKQSLPENRFLV